MRSLVLHPDPVLRRRAEAVGEIDQRVRDLAQEMIRIMHEEDGYGLAAPQVGESVRIFVTQVPRLHEDSCECEECAEAGDDAGTESGDSDASDDGDEEEVGGIVYINPRLVHVGGTLEAEEEGCLSLPGIRCTVRRQVDVEIEALDIDGQPFRMRSDGLLARCWQHEIDHLDGVLIIDRMSVMDRLANRKKIKALEERE